LLLLSLSYLSISVNIDLLSGYQRCLHCFDAVGLVSGRASSLKKTSASKPLGMAVNVGWQGTAQSGHGSSSCTAPTYIKYPPMNVLRIRMTGAWESRGQLAIPGWLGKWLLRWYVKGPGMDILSWQETGSVTDSNTQDDF